MRAVDATTCRADTRSKARRRVFERTDRSAVTLPDGRVLILSGTDQDTSDPPRASSTKVRQAVPEVYDPATDTTVALESARKLLPMYPRSFVVQTGPKPNDWKVAVVAEMVLPPPADISGYDPFEYNGNTHLLDVQAALADKHRDVRGENHWERVDKALHSHESGASAAIFETDHRGQAHSQKIAVFGGDGADGPVAAVETIDFAQRPSRWSHAAELVRPARQNNAVVLPDGKVVRRRGEDLLPGSPAAKHRLRLGKAIPHRVREGHECTTGGFENARLQGR